MDFEELSFATSWIALQEEINYPQPKFDGLKRPLLVYFGTIHYAAMGQSDAMRGLQLAVHRALFHGRLSLLPCVNYAEILVG